MMVVVVVAVAWRDDGHSDGVYYFEGLANDPTNVRPPTLMLERIHIENYKCLRDVTVDLGDFTVLIGPNDSGKSSFLEVVQTLGKIAGPEHGRAFDGDRSPGNLVWRKDAGRPILMEVAGAAAEHRFDYHLGITVEQQADERLEWDGRKVFWTDVMPGDQPMMPAGTPVVAIAADRGSQFHRVNAGQRFLYQFIQQRPVLFRAVTDALASNLYQLDLNQLPLPSVPKPGITLETSGANLAGVLDVMQNSPDRSAFDALQETLREAIPTLSGIVLPPAAKPAGAKAMEFILAGNGQAPVTIPASLGSSGALLLTAFLTLAYTPTPGLLLFEEPENGLHPFRLEMVFDILRRMSRGEIGNRKRQIILTTHNPLLLNCARPDEVRVFVRHPEDGTKVIPMTQVPDIERLLKEFALGELWYLLGEEKLFQEQRA